MFYVGAATFKYLSSPLELLGDVAIECQQSAISAEKNTKNSEGRAKDDTTILKNTEAGELKNDPQGQRQKYECLVAKYTGSLANFTRWLVAVTLLLAFFGFWQVIISRNTARRQLRAYLSMKPKLFGNFGTAIPVTIEFLTKNHGQTPAFNISQIFQIEVLPNPLPEGFRFPQPTIIVSTNHTIFPADDAKTWFNHPRPLTVAEVAAVSNNSHRIHVWGIAYYRDAFGRSQKTKFSASVGGPAFATAQRNVQAGLPPGADWNWEYGIEHNQGT
jgi:hypothetical protein